MPGRLAPPFLNLTRHGHHHRNSGFGSDDTLIFPITFNIPLFFFVLFLFFIIALSITAVIYITRHLRSRRRRMNFIYDPSSIIKGPVGPNDHSMIAMDLHSHLFLSDACRQALVERYRTNHCGPAF